MEYADIIRENCEKHSPVSWWPKFAFHCTDVMNAVSILGSGYLYSRTDATHLGVMKNDNASRQVIDMTNSEIASKVRFYFRPLTPTQYYSEGYKHPNLRYDLDENANIPVPIFFLFDLNRVLSIPGIQFSEFSQAGRGAELYSGVENFSKLNFDYIYDNKYETFETTKPYRHAEIIHSDTMSIENSLKNILCRNGLEKNTLLRLLREQYPLAFEKYHHIVKVYNQDVFFNNGIYISDCSYHDDIINISFSDTYACKHYIDNRLKKLEDKELKPIKVTIGLKWFNSRTIYKQETIESTIDVCNPKSITIKKLPKVPRAKEICIEVFLDGKLMCHSVRTIETVDLWK